MKDVLFWSHVTERTHIPYHRIVWTGNGKWFRYTVEAVERASRYEGCIQMTHLGIAIYNAG